MSNLSKRVEKAKKAEYTSIPGFTKKAAFGTWGSSGSYKNRYQIFITPNSELINNPSDPHSKIQILVLETECYQNKGIGTECNCPGNERHTVCYHTLGAIYNAYLNKSQKYVYFYETYQDALHGLRLYKSAKLLKVKSTQGEGVIWAITRPIEKKTKNLDSLAVNLMRGGQDDEGID